MKNLGVGVFSVLVALNFNVCAQNNNNLESCEQYFQQGDWEKAQEFCTIAVNGDATNVQKLNIQINLALIYLNLDNVDKASQSLQSAQNNPAFVDQKLSQYDWNRYQGQLAFLDGQYKKSLDYFTQAFDLSVQLDNEKLKSRSYNDFGVVYDKTGDYSQAIENFQKSLAIKLTLGDDLVSANTLSNIGSLLFELEKYDDSISYALQAIEYYQRVDNDSAQKMITHVHEELSMAYLKTGQDDKAQFYINEIVASNKVRTTNEEQSNANLALAKYYYEEDKPEIARVLLNQAIYTDKPMYFLETSLELAKIELELGNTEKAQNIALEGLKVAKENDDVFYQFNFNHLLSQSMEQDQPLKALSYLKDYQRAREDFLKKKYDSKIDTIEYQIKKHKFDKELLTEQLANSEKQKRIAGLTNLVLMVSLFLMITVMAWLLYIYKKRKQTQEFLAQIKYHKDQFELLNAAQQEQVVDEKATNVITKHDFKEALIKAMVEAVDIWNRHTGKNRIDLAEKSKVWAVTVDNGTLRTRSMDKYLSIKNIPANPRWRKVVRTCHFILSDSSLNTIDRGLLNDNVNKIMDVIKKL